MVLGMYVADVVHAISKRDKYGSTTSSGYFHQVEKDFPAYSVRGRHDETKEKKATSVNVLSRSCISMTVITSVSSWNY